MTVGGMGLYVAGELSRRINFRDNGIGEIGVTDRFVVEGYDHDGFVVGAVLKNPQTLMSVSGGCFLQ